eukprot:s225_g28.t1
MHDNVEDDEDDDDEEEEENNVDNVAEDNVEDDDVEDDVKKEEEDGVEDEHVEDDDDKEDNVAEDEMKYDNVAEDEVEDDDVEDDDVEGRKMMKLRMMMLRRRKMMMHRLEQSKCTWTSQQSPSMREFAAKYAAAQRLGHTLCASLRSRNAHGHLMNANLRKNAAAQDRGIHFVRACRVETHMDISGKPLYARIYIKNAPAQDRGTYFVRACAVETHMDISGKPFYARIYIKNAAAQDRGAYFVRACAVLLEGAAVRVLCALWSWLAGAAARAWLLWNLGVGAAAGGRCEMFMAVWALGPHGDYVDGVSKKKSLAVPEGYAGAVQSVQMPLVGRQPSQQPPSFQLQIQPTQPLQQPLPLQQPMQQLQMQQPHLQTTQPMAMLPVQMQQDIPQATPAGTLLAVPYPMSMGMGMLPMVMSTTGQQATRATTQLTPSKEETVARAPDGPPLGRTHRFHQKNSNMGMLSSDARAFTKKYNKGRLSIVSENKVHFQGAVQGKVVGVPWQRRQSLGIVEMLGQAPDDGPEPWRKTGRKAKEDQWLGLEENVLIEFAVYDDRENQQGRMVAQLKSRGEVGTKDEGQVWPARALGAEDPTLNGGSKAPTGRIWCRCTFVVATQDDAVVEPFTDALCM